MDVSGQDSRSVRWNVIGASPESARRTHFRLPWFGPGHTATRPFQKTLGVAPSLLGGSRQDRPPLTTLGWLRWLGHHDHEGPHVYPPAPHWGSRISWLDVRTLAGLTEGTMGRTCRDRRSRQTISGKACWGGPIPELLAAALDFRFPSPPPEGWCPASNKVIRNCRHRSSHVLLQMLETKRKEQRLSLAHGSLQILWFSLI